MNERETQEREPAPSLSQAETVPEPPASGAQAGATQKQELSTSYADIVVLCHPRGVQNTVEMFEDQIRHAEGTLPLFVLWSGTSGRGLEVIVLEWEGIVTQEFLRNLALDSEIFEYVVYAWTRDNGGEEQTRENQNDRNEMERRQLV